MILIILICCLLKSYRYLQILQLEHYNVNKYLKYIKNNYIYYNLIPLFCFIVIYFLNDIPTFISVVVLFIFLSLSTTVSIVKLKFTNKIIRIYIVQIILFIFLLISPILYFFLFEFIILIPFLLNKPIDLIINKKYLKRSEKKFKEFKNIKIGITGSYGKTSTKNIINDLLKNIYLGSCSYKSYNTLLGISKYINDIPLEVYDYVILEYGASNQGDIKEITDKFKPNIACVTEIGYMHLDTFKTIDNIIEEKMSILNGVDVAILNYEQPLIRNYNVNINAITYGFNYGDYQAKNIKIYYDHTVFDLFYKGRYITNIVTKLVGRHQILNLLCAICVLHYLNLDIYNFLSSIKILSNTENRLTYNQYQKYEILDDSYNANIVGSINALEILNSMENNKILITPGFVENKDVEEELYIKYSEKIIEVNPFVILVGNRQTKILQKLLDKKVDFIVVDSFKQAMVYVNELKEYHTILIENDLPDNYKRVI